MTATTKNIHQRLAQVMESVTYIRKEQKNGMNYTIVSHDAVTAKVRPALLAAGIVYYPIRCEHTQNGNRAECGMTVRFVNVDEPADFFDVQTFGYGVDPQDKGPGKAMSYAVKYALLKALGLETGDDPDQDSIAHSKDDPAVAPPSTKHQQPTTSPAVALALDVISNADDMAALANVWGMLSRDVQADSSVKDAKEARKAVLSRSAKAQAAHDAQRPAA